MLLDGGPDHIRALLGAPLRVPPHWRARYDVPRRGRGWVERHRSTFWKFEIWRATEN